ncbi:hypothetical protein KIK06_08855 [Nocardiopsis sp. EMB25]|uniref:hypothetical protein n=1 Tax=Nocardiopsis TaxID=2013 RepID=UPI00034713F4|nr:MULTISPECIES: hypothetical protein [Nocardiopsis]MCY9784000.1 hypothetical protein [Nocardiopsis sp. EMB25]
MLKRTGATSLAVAAVVLGATPPANADTADEPATAGSTPVLTEVECGSEGGSGCTVVLSHTETTGGAEGASTTGTGTASTATGDPDDPYADVDWSAVDWDAVDWDAVDWDAIDWDAIDYDGEDGATPTDPVTLIQESLASFELPPPQIATSPGDGSLVLVNTPLWLWIDDQTWAPVTATAEIPGWSLTITATPRESRWEMGDGDEVVCEGPGTAFDPERHAPESASPDCGHAYTRASGARDGGTYTVTTGVVWDIAWEFSDGTAGELDPVTTTSEVEVTVDEAQGLVSDSGR